MPVEEGPTPPAKATPSFEDLDLLEAECEVEFVRASGPGGQHRNKVESGVRLTHLPTGLRVTATERRSQSQNRRAALERLRELLRERSRPVKPRRATRKTRAAREAELATKKHRAQVKRDRSGGRSADWD